MTEIGKEPVQQDHSEEGVQQSAKIIADIAATFTYASYQNAIPVVRSLVIENFTSQHFERCVLELCSTPAFLRAKTWTIDRLMPGDRLTISDRKVELDPGYLAGLNEAERGEITLRLIASENVLLESRIPVRLLARDEWGGVADMAQLLPAFVMPNDPAVAQVLRTAAERLEAHGLPSGLDGYQSGNPQRAYALAAAIYSAVAGLGIHYAEPPASFESRGQKIRRPSTILEEKLATCLDSTLLFAAALEAAGLYPVILLFEGHAAVGAWLNKTTFGQTVVSDQMEVRKALASQELIVFETTGITQRPPMILEGAERLLKLRLEEEKADDFVAAIDVRRARSGGIIPLASHEPIRRNIGEQDGTTTIELPLPPLPQFSEMPAEVVEVKPTTAAGRIDRWQRKLLDLSLRNRLLNFSNSRKSIPFLCTDVAYLEDRLASGAAVGIISLPEQNPLGARDPGLFREVHGRDIQREFAAEALLRDELTSPLEPKELEARLIELYRQVKNDYAEGGANTLFLAVGFLRWKKKPDDERIYRAPLLLVPVKLDRRSASSPFKIRFHEDETRFNSTLVQFLEREFDLSLPQFTGELPMDDNGVDVPRLLAMMRHAVRNVAGMEVVDEAALSTFSFAKFLMWKDLVERTEALRQNRVVRHLIDSPEQPFAEDDGTTTFPSEKKLDEEYSPAEIVSLLPMDSSQAAACLAAAKGKDFIILGPPGTGKSQTITNMIANCLAVGKTVLFVAEKTAALDVVYRRLKEHGLGNHCIELHSNKADRRYFLNQLKAAWEHGGRPDLSEWIAVNERLKLRRDELNAYVAALHKRYSNGWTPYQALGIALKGADAAAPVLAWDRQEAHRAEEFLELEELSAKLGRVFASITHKPCFRLIDATDWSSIWQDRLLATASDLTKVLDRLEHDAAAFAGRLGVTARKGAVWSHLRSFARLAEALVSSAGHDIRIAYDRDFGELEQALGALERSIQTYREAEQGLAARYTEKSVRSLDLEALNRQWREAQASFWPASMLARRKCQKLLQSYVDGGQVDPQRDLPLLERMKEGMTAIDGNLLVGKPLPFNGLDTDIGEIANRIRLAGELRMALAIPDLGREERKALLQAVMHCLPGQDPGGLRAAAMKFLSAFKAVNATQTAFSQLAGHKLDLEQEDFEYLKQKLAELSTERHILRDWVVWCAVRQHASAAGLVNLTDMLEAGAIRPENTRDAFRLAYARWWLPKVLDNDPVLRNFRRFEHDNAIKEFKELDDLVRIHAVGRVVSAIAHDLPPVQGVPRNSDLGLLRHQMQLQRPSQSIREMIARMPQSFPKLAPCMLMSPLSVVQYLPATHPLFDVVIFDEASQITTWDAVGAIARARQTIIVGDPKQLPPTNFFGRVETEDEEIAEHEKDLESILDEVQTAGIPIRELKWHYRSRSESLIAFSNHHYYQNRLITFPSPKVDDRAVHLRKVVNGVYDRGKSRTNRIEADAVVAEAVSRMKRWLEFPERERPTLGIITFNVQQQSLILDLLDQARRDDVELEWYFSEQRVEPTIVKNLENVQGDERDVILFSITFAKDAAGKLAMDFGALNRDGGERRLNVAITRARQELIVFSALTADQIDLSRTKALGVHHLKTFLDYAERGAIALPAQDEWGNGTYESPFEEAIATCLTARGWSVIPQVGVSGFRIDLGVRHPDLPGAYLAGVECDGATYHSAATARDRDKVREQVLRGLGWNIVRVWSTDWWYDPAGCADRLHAELEQLLAESRARRADWQEVPVHWDMGHQVEEIEEIREEDADLVEETDATPLTSTPTDRVAADVTTAREPAAAPAILAQQGADRQEPARVEYRVTDLSGFAANPDRFFDADYDAVIRAMVDAIIETEAPLRTDILAQRIARAHGWLRTGGRIRERIERHLGHLERTMESSGEFIWKKDATAALLPYRHAAGEDARRSIMEIPLAELAGVVTEHPDLLQSSDPARELARILGVERLVAVSRARLEEAIEKARQLDAVN